MHVMQTPVLSKDSLGVFSLPARLAAVAVRGDIPGRDRPFLNVPMRVTCRSERHVRIGCISVSRLIGRALQMIVYGRQRASATYPSGNQEAHRLLCLRYVRRRLTAHAVDMRRASVVHRQRSCLRRCRPAARAASAPLPSATAPTAVWGGPGALPLAAGDDAGGQCDARRGSGSTPSLAADTTPTRPDGGGGTTLSA